MEAVTISTAEKKRIQKDISKCFEKYRMAKSILPLEGESAVHFDQQKKKYQDFCKKVEAEILGGITNDFGTTHSRRKKPCSRGNRTFKK